MRYLRKTKIAGPTPSHSSTGAGRGDVQSCQVLEADRLECRARVRARALSDGKYKRLARQFASIDHISNGRAAWNIVTSWLATAAENYGGAGQVSHADRYARGEEFMEVVKALWDSWAADAVVDDRTGGIYARGDRIRAINQLPHGRESGTL